MKVIPQKGYTDQESAQIAAFVAAAKADPRSWQERVIQNAPAEIRAEIAAVILPRAE